MEHGGFTIDNIQLNVGSVYGAARQIPVYMREGLWKENGTEEKIKYKENTK